MKIKKVSFDTMSIVDAAQSLESLLYINKKWNLKHHRLIISTRVEGEAINRLQKAPYNYDREQAKEMVGKVITHLNLHREFKEDVDDKDGNELIKKYGNTECHYPDSTIIAHMKRIDVDIVITRDKKFKEVAEKEGLKVHYIPTKESIIGHRVSQLFRGRH